MKSNVTPINTGNETADKKNEERPISPEEVYENAGLIISMAKNELHMNHADAEDLLQEVVIKCWKKESIRLNPAIRAHLPGYLKAVARNTGIDMLRKKQGSGKKRSKKISIVYIEENKLQALAEQQIWEDSTWREEKYKQQQKMLQQGIEELYRSYPSKTAIDAMLMFILEGKSAKEVAQALKVSEEFVNISVFRGKRRIQEIVKRIARNTEAEAEENWQEAC